MLEQITPVVLTRNEGPNIARTLGALTWARDIVVVDSFSEDDTVDQVARIAQARVVRRRFDSHAAQWNFAIHETGIRTEWVLALDADYVLPAAAVEEIRSLRPAPGTGGYRASFTYVVGGRHLRGSAYPPVTILYRRAAASYVQDGHTQRVTVAGAIEPLNTAVLHDDRKPLDAWLLAQLRYMRLEAKKLRASPWHELGWKDRIRKLKVVAPAAMAIHCLLLKGGILDGRAGVYYASQRVFAELLLSLYLFSSDAGSAAPERAPETVRLGDSP